MESIGIHLSMQLTDWLLFEVAPLPAAHWSDRYLFCEKLVLTTQEETNRLFDYQLSCAGGFPFAVCKCEVRVQIHKEVISDLKLENQFCHKRNWSLLYMVMINLSRDICKPVLKLDFTARGLMESSLSEFQPNFRTQQNVFNKIKTNNICAKICLLSRKSKELFLFNPAVLV